MTGPLCTAVLLCDVIRHCIVGEARHALLGRDPAPQGELAPADLRLPRVWGVRHDEGGRGEGMAGREGGSARGK